MDRRQFLQTSSAMVASTALATTLGGTILAKKSATGNSGGIVNASVGYIENDFDPRVSPITHLAAAGQFDLDYLYRSVGADLGSRQLVQALELISDRGPHRLNTRDLSVYTSDDNATWSLQKEAEFLDLGQTIWLYGLNAMARYVKVHCHRDGIDQTASTFGNADLQTMLTVHRLGTNEFVAGTGSWKYRTQIEVSNPGQHNLRDQAVFVTLAQLGTKNLIERGQLNADLSDLRFADASGAELHAYSDADGVFVRIPEIQAGKSQSISAYSGNPTAVSTLSDSGALQVEYGRRTYRDQGGQSAAEVNFGSELHPVLLPSGTLMIVAATTAAAGLHARYSADQGRTWGTPEPLIPPSDATAGTDRPGGFLVDPKTGMLTAVFYSVGHTAGGDWTDPTQHLCRIWAAQAPNYDTAGRPLFNAARQIDIENHATGASAAWAITYSNPIVTRTGAYVVTVPYIYNPEGGFALAIIRSTDQGATWQQSATPLKIRAAGVEGGVSESTIAELSSGELVVYARQQSASEFYFGQSVSSDDGVTWPPITDSTILASNTVPTFLHDDDEILLSWSGHNAFGQVSYQRNNLTIAYSGDDTHSWSGYQDVTGATSLSNPGWFSDGQARQMVESFIVPAGPRDLLVAWASSLQGHGGTLLIEDIERYLHDSHGALDVIRYARPEGTTDGTELSQSRWWRSTTGGTLQLATGVRTEGSALHLTTSDPAETAGISRLFPGLRTGRVRFQFKWSALTSGLRIALQEGYASDFRIPNVGANARGTIVVLKLDPDGTVTTTTDHVYDAAALGGLVFSGNDATQASLAAKIGPPVAFDYDNRAIGLDLIDSRQFDGLVLTGLAEFADGGQTRLEPSDLRVWTSNTNDHDWIEASGWSGTKDGLTITLNGPALTTRYVKVTQSYSDKAFTFANDMQRIIAPLPAVPPDVEKPQKFQPLATPTTIAQDVWHTMQFDVDLASDQVDITIDGQQRAHVRTLHPAQILTHLLMISDTGGTTEIYVDELMVQDTSLGLPNAGRIGDTIRV